MDIFESLENLNVSEECFDEILRIFEENILRGTDAELSYLIDTPREELDDKQRERKRSLYAKRVRGLRKLLANKEATNKAGEEHQKAIEANLKECFEYVFALMEELLAESNYSAADIVAKAKKVLPQREAELKKAEASGDYWNALNAEDRRDHAKALASLPSPKKSGISAKKLDKAAFNAAIKRGIKMDNASTEKEEDYHSDRQVRAANIVNDQKERRFNALMNRGARY